MKNKVYFIRISENFEEEVFKHLLSAVGIDKQRKINKLAFNIDKKLSLYADLSIRIIVFQNLLIDNKKIIYEYNRFGKPYLIGFPAIHFNVSHTRNAIVVGFSEQPIGVDVEKITKRDENIEYRFFTKNECDYILSCENQDKGFYEVWTRKEAYTKYLGKGLSYPFNLFDVFENRNISEKIRTVQRDEYIISYCSESDVDNICEEELPEYRIEKLALSFLV